MRTRTDSAKRYGLALTVVALVIGFAPRLASAGDGRRADQRNEDAMLKYLRPALKPAGGAGRFYSTQPCRAGQIPLRFPRLRVQPPRTGTHGVAAVQDIFRGEKLATVTKDVSGMVRIRVGKVPSAILETRIRSLSLKPEERYTPQLAIIALTGSKEVEAAMRRLGLEHPVVVASIGIQVPMPGLRHLPKRFTDVSLDEALDEVAKTFRGIVTYEVCTARAGGGFFHVWFKCVACEP